MAIEDTRLERIEIATTAPKRRGRGRLGDVLPAAGEAETEVPIEASEVGVGVAEGISSMPALYAPTVRRS